MQCRLLGVDAGGRCVVMGGPYGHRGCANIGLEGEGKR